MVRPVAGLLSARHPGNVLLKRKALTMKQLIRFLSALALASAATAPGDILIYQLRSTSKNIGEGVEFSYSTRGYIVWNLEINHFTWISYFGRGDDKHYAVSDGEP